MNPDGSERKNLSNNDSGELYPTWSPDGSKIAFVSEINGISKIFIMDMNGSNRKNIIGKDLNGNYPLWSPINS
jgi:TolB protein